MHLVSLIVSIIFLSGEMVLSGGKNVVKMCVMPMSTWVLMGE